MTKPTVIGCLCSALLFLSCAGDEPMPVPSSSPASTDDESQLSLRTCPGDAPEQDAVFTAVRMLGSKDGQAAQFGFDGLRSILASNPKARRTVVCYLDDQRPVRVAELLVLNRSPGAFEATAHYQPKSVFAAIALALGSPPSLPNACSLRPDSRQPDLKRCLEGWQWYLDQKP